MLQEKSPYTGKVMAIRTMVGEEILCKVTKETDDSFYIEHPHTLVMSHEGMGLRATNMLIDVDNKNPKEVRFYKCSISMIYEPNKDFVEQFESIVSPIVKASSKIIT